MRVNTDETIRRGLEARTEAGSWMELRRRSASERFTDGAGKARRVAPGNSDEQSSTAG